MTESESVQVHPEWILSQKKVFKNWCNIYLQKRNLKIENDLQTELFDGLVLANLLEILSGKNTLVSKCKKIKSRVHYINNLNYSLKFITDDNAIRLVGCGAEDIVDGNLKLIMGLIWSLILRFQIQTLNTGNQSLNSSSTKNTDFLLNWIKNLVKDDYTGPITDFTTSFQNGLLFCDIINNILKSQGLEEAIDYKSLRAENQLENLTLAFETANTVLNIPPILDPQDFLKSPDELCVLTYLSLFPKVQSSQQQNKRFSLQITPQQQQQFQPIQKSPSKQSLEVINERINSLTKSISSSENLALLSLEEEMEDHNKLFKMVLGEIKTILSELLPDEELKTLQDQFSILEQEMKKKTDYYSDSVKNANEQLANLKKTNTEVIEKMKLDFNGEVQVIQNEMSRIKEEKERLEHSEQQDLDRIKSLELQLTDAKNEYQQKEISYKDQLLNENQQQIQIYQDKTNELNLIVQLKNNELEQINSKLSSITNEFQSKITTLEQNNAKLQENIDTMTSSNEKVVEDLNLKIKELQENNDKKTQHFEEESKQLQDNNNLLSKEIEEINVKNNELIDESKLKIQQLQDNNNLLSKELEEINNMNKELRNNNMDQILKEVEVKLEKSELQVKEIQEENKNQRNGFKELILRVKSQYTGIYQEYFTQDTSSSALFNKLFISEIEFDNNFQFPEQVQYLQELLEFILNSFKQLSHDNKQYIDSIKELTETISKVEIEYNQSKSELLKEILNRDKLLLHSDNNIKELSTSLLNSEAITKSQQDEINLHKLNIQEISLDLEIHIQKLGQLDIEHKQALQDNKDLNISLKQLESETNRKILDLEEKYNQQLKKNNETSNQDTELSEKFKELQNEIKSKQTLLQERDIHIQELSNNNQQLQNSAQDLQTHQDQILSDRNAELVLKNQEIHNLGLKHQELQLEMENNQKFKDTLELQINTLSQEINEKNNLIQDLLGRLESEKKEATESKHSRDAEILGLLKEKEKEIEKLSKDIIMITDDKNALKSANELMISEIKQKTHDTNIMEDNYMSRIQNLETSAQIAVTNQNQIISDMEISHTQQLKIKDEYIKEMQQIIKEKEETIVHNETKYKSQKQELNEKVIQLERDNHNNRMNSHENNDDDNNDIPIIENYDCKEIDEKIEEILEQYPKSKIYKLADGSYLINNRVFRIIINNNRLFIESQDGSKVFEPIEKYLLHYQSKTIVNNISSGYGNLTIISMMILGLLIGWNIKPGNNIPYYFDKPN